MRRRRRSLFYAGSEYLRSRFRGRDSAMSKILTVRFWPGRMLLIFSIGMNIASVSKISTFFADVLRSKSDGTCSIQHSMITPRNCALLTLASIMAFDQFFRLRAVAVMNNLRPLLTSLILSMVFLVNAALAQTSSCQAPTRIMLLGDSITDGEGSADNYGYRATLHSDLFAAGHSVDFVGGRQDLTGTHDRDHEGWAGFTASQISNNVFSWLTANPADYVLLHAGTNGLDVNNVVDVENILDEIDRYSTGIEVVLARIIDEKSINPTVTAFNDAVESMVLSRIASGDKITIVDQHLNPLFCEICIQAIRGFLNTAVLIVNR